MPTRESTYHLMVKPTAENLTALASMDLLPAQPHIVVRLAPEQYELLPHRQDVRRQLTIDCEKMGANHVYTSDSIRGDLERLLECYNDENHPRKFSHAVDTDLLDLPTTYRLLSVVAACSDEEDRIRPWEASTSVTEALADHELNPEDVFTDRAPQREGSDT